jgi:hypothetical protein
MSWIKEANKLGVYEDSLKGFRIYCTKNAEIKSSVVELDGELWNRTDIIAGHFVAVDKNGFRIEAKYMDEIKNKILLEDAQRFCDKRGW